MGVAIPLAELLWLLGGAIVSLWTASPAGQKALSEGAKAADEAIKNAADAIKDIAREVPQSQSCSTQSCGGDNGDDDDDKKKKEEEKKKTPEEVKEVKIDSKKHPESAQHIKDAQKAGQPSELTIDRAGAEARRAESLKGIDKVPGKQLDEYPPAMFKEGGAGASVRPIRPGDNMGSGASIGNQLRGVPDGTKIKIVVD